MGNSEPLKQVDKKILQRINPNSVALSRAIQKGLEHSMQPTNLELDFPDLVAARVDTYLTCSASPSTIYPTSWNRNRIFMQIKYKIFVLKKYMFQYKKIKYDKRQILQHLSCV